MPDEMNQQQTQQMPPEQAPQQVQPAQQVQQPPIQQPGVAVQQPVATVGTSGLAIAGLVLGILAFLLSFIPLMNLGSIIMGLLGLVLAVVGLISTKNGKQKGKGIAIAGIILSILALAVVFLMYGTAAAVSDSSKSEGSATSATQQTAQTSAAQEAPAQTSAAAEAATSAEPAQDAAAASAPEEATSEPATAEASQAQISIDGVRLGQDYDGNEIAIVSYTWTNTTDETTAFAYNYIARAYQNGVEITDFTFSDDVNQDGYSANVKPGGTTSFEWPYPIKDHSDLTVEIQEIISFDNTIIAEQTFKLE